MKPLFIISCPFDTYSGYGARSRDLVKAIIETNKYEVKLLSQRWGNTPFGFCNDNQEWNFLNNYSWLHILIQLDSSFKDYFNHEFSHVMNYIRGFSEEELGHKEPEIYANSSDEIKSRVIEIFSALNKEIASGNLVLKNLISRKDYDGFIEYVFSKYKNIILPDLSNENTKEIYKQRLLNFFLELWNKNS